MDFELKENHLTFFFLLLMFACLLLREYGLSLASLTILAVGLWAVVPIRNHFLKVNKSEVEILKDEILQIRSELNALKIQQGIKTLR